MLVTQQNTLVKHLKNAYKNAGSKLVEGDRTFFHSEELLRTILEMSNHGIVYLVMDALDGCGSGLSELLELIADNGFASPSRLKWLITSRKS